MQWQLGIDAMLEPMVRLNPHERMRAMGRMSTDSFTIPWGWILLGAAVLLAACGVALAVASAEIADNDDHPENVLRRADAALRDDGGSASSSEEPEGPA